ncbi:MAG TPA: uracil-DNA glycosylase [Anaerovoracaceae bacterium]|nr:uracil-DNA glycosylase [Anaerovoracaceae bacterium]
MNKLESLKVIADAAAACTSCELHKTRIKSVFSRGNPDSKIVFVGEAPGADENEQGLPFVGRAGKLLDAMIGAMGFNRDDIYVCNICKCRPPDNRKPLPDEMSACKPFLTQQLDIVQPKVIVALGATAVEGLLGPGLGITKRRGNWGIYNGIKVMPTFHPSYLLRNPSAKDIVKLDLQAVLSYLKE